MQDKPELIKVGWREWLSLPDLNLPAVKAKIDTGARTSALHAFSVEPFQYDSLSWVRFGFHPISKNDSFEMKCQAPIKDQREVTDSGGHTELRYVIETTLDFGDNQWPIELTLTNRDNMRFRMLLGRRAMVGRLWVDPAVSYQTGKLNSTKLYQL
ncbi:MAG: hypothetical protein ACI8XC_000117 [Gammaproteobacteria bacterium]|jgi:hypothetical protein